MLGRDLSSQFGYKINNSDSQLPVFLWSIFRSFYELTLCNLGRSFMEYTIAGGEIVSVTECSLNKDTLSTSDRIFHNGLTEITEGLFIE